MERCMFFNLAIYYFDKMISFCRLRFFCNKFEVTKKQLRKCSQSVHNDVRVRFAPSPTGFLHIGGLRTALYNYLFAKSHKNGKFIIRIEDTDQTRVVPGAIGSLLSTLDWMGLTPDESPNHEGWYGPYLQSERLHHYNKHAEGLVKNGSAYRCFCSHERLSLLKKDQQQRKELPRYDNRCRYLTAAEVEENLAIGKPYVVRLKVDAVTEEIEDELFGNISHRVGLEGDPVLVKSDKFPTYHLANVVDDHLMKISHVIRGKEWLVSTPKHVLIYKAFGWKPPRFLHLPLLVNSNRTKLSKRQGDVFVEDFRKQGFHPSALLNFVSYCGGGFPGTTFPLRANDHHMLLRQLSQAFDADKLLQSDAMVDFAKLDEFSRDVMSHLVDRGNLKIRRQMVHELFDLALSKYGKRCLLNDKTLTADRVKNYLNIILETRKGHVATVGDLVCKEYDYLWIRPKREDEEGLECVGAVLDVVNYLDKHDVRLKFLPEITEELSEIAESHDLKYPAFMKILRNLLSGKVEGPAVAEMLVMLGKEEAILRLDSAHQKSSLLSNAAKEKVLNGGDIS